MRRDFFLIGNKIYRFINKLDTIDDAEANENPKHKYINQADESHNHVKILGEDIYKEVEPDPFVLGYTSSEPYSVVEMYANMRNNYDELLTERVSIVEKKRIWNSYNELSFTSSYHDDPLDAFLNGLASFGKYVLVGAGGAIKGIGKVVGKAADGADGFIRKDFRRGWECGRRHRQPV